MSRSQPDRNQRAAAGLVKLFFADAIPPAEAGVLLDAIKQRSEDQLAALRAIEPAATAAEQAGNVYPLLTLHIGIGYHQAMIDVCRDFQRRLQPVPDAGQP